MKGGVIAALALVIALGAAAYVVIANIGTSSRLEQRASTRDVQQDLDLARHQDALHRIEKSLARLEQTVGHLQQETEKLRDGQDELRARIEDLSPTIEVLPVERMVFTDDEPHSVPVRLRGDGWLQISGIVLERTNESGGLRIAIRSEQPDEPERGPFVYRQGGFRMQVPLVEGTYTVRFSEATEANEGGTPDRVRVADLKIRTVTGPSRE